MLFRSPIFLNKYNDKNVLKEEVINKIIENRKINKDIFFNLKKEDFYFIISSFSKEDFKYQIEFEDSKKDIEIIANKIEFDQDVPNRNSKEKIANKELNFCKDYKEEPTYDIFDNDKLDEIVENIYNEIKSYMDIIVEELK